MTLAMLVIAGGGALAQEYPGREKLRAQSSEFRRDVIQVTEGVYVAVGYSASNVILVQGDGGSIIVDTAADLVAARQIVEAFGGRLRAPVRAIIYTHSHPDHTGGALAFARNDRPEIYSHQRLLTAAPDAGRAGRDGGDQFGMSLPASLFINAGVQMEFGRVTPPSREGYLPPTRTFDGNELSLTIAGVRVQLLYTPGETNDTIAVWLPDKRVVMTGDNMLRTFPNVAPIRGARLRSPDAWVASLNKVLALAPEFLVPSHTRPVLGARAAREALTASRDGLKSILDQTVEGIRKGERPDELVAHVRLPSPLAEHPFLQEFYGGVEWTVRGIYADQVGWFDGNPTRLFPLPEKDRATRLVALIGGVERVLEQGQAALAADDFTWAAELADYVLVNDTANVGARRIKGRALMELGERQINAIARNYYLTSGMYLLKDLPPAAASAQPAAIQIQTEDVERFFTIYEAASGHPSTEQLQRDYLDRGTAGLHHLAKVRNVTGERIAQAVAAEPELYTNARSCLAVLPRVRARLDRTFEALLDVYPEAQKPPVTILVSRGRPLAIAGPGDGVQIGLEGMCSPTAAKYLDANVDDRFVRVIAHEYIHAQQAPALASTEDLTVLERSLLEGVAEFMAEQLTGSVSNVAIRTTTVGREREIETRFAADVDKRDLSAWVDNTTADSVGQLGYWVGYRIAKSFYQRASDKRIAIRELIQMTDAHALLARSGWSPGIVLK